MKLGGRTRVLDMPWNILAYRRVLESVADGDGRDMPVVSPPSEP
jgi:hypothetical protein